MDLVGRSRRRGDEQNQFACIGPCGSPAQLDGPVKRARCISATDRIGSFRERVGSLAIVADPKYLSDANHTALLWKRLILRIRRGDFRTCASAV